MNYIPGFSNYLQSSVPAYTKGGPARFNEDAMYAGGYGAEPIMYSDPMAGAAPIMDTYQQAAVMPTTQEAAPAAGAAPYDLSSLAGLDLSGLGGLNFSGFGGGRMGGVIEDPNIQYITAPVSNKGNNTARAGMGGNVFSMRADQPVRLVDRNTNTIIFEGTGYDAAREATRLGQSITDARGRKASYDIQTANPAGVYTTVANEKRNKTFLGDVANVVGTALPLAALAIPGLNVLGGIAVGAGLGGAGAALKGDNILKGAALGGLSAAGGSVLGPAFEAGGKFGTALAPRLATAVGTGIGATAGGLATGQNLQNSLIGGALSGGFSYLTPNIQEGLGIGKGTNVNTSGTGGADASFDGINVLGGGSFTPTNIGTTLGGSPNKIQQALNQTTEAPFDGITAIGNRLGGLSGVNFGGNQFGASGKDPSAFDKLTDTSDIVVTASPATQPVTPVTVPVTGGGLPTTNVVEPIVVTAGGTTKPVTPVTVPVTGGNIEQTITPEYLPKEDIVVTGNGRTDPPVTGGLTLTDAVIKDIDTKSAEEQAKEEEAKNKLGLEEYLRLLALGIGAIGGKGGSGSQGTYGNGRLNPIFSAKLPTANIPGGVGAASNLGARPMGEQDWLTYGQRPELSFYDYVPKPTGMAEGGMFAAKHGGQSRRTEFAVNGAGTGRSDDIPAVLSDGEYVMDAETVALLGDGSSKAGAKKLDELRVKVRKHKGQKLAKGRFSANAKRPEAYLSGGRI